MPEEPQQNPSALEVSSSVEGPNYWRNLVVEIMKKIPPIPLEGPSKLAKLAHRVARHNPKVY